MEIPFAEVLVILISYVAIVPNLRENMNILFLFLKQPTSVTNGIKGCAKRKDISIHVYNILSVSCYYSNV